MLPFGSARNLIEQRIEKLLLARVVMDEKSFE